MRDSIDTSIESDSAESGSSGGDKGLLALGGLGAAVASACCILPFVLVTLGLGGAWLANLHALYPYRWLFIGAAAVALFFAWRRLYRPQTECADGEACAVPTVKRVYRVLFWVIAGLLALSAVAPYLLGAILN
ncbi:MAG: mercuric transport protein [Pseudomonadota bacterium]|nr:MAG: mercuric transport protein [Pseudomonadota bacterium]